MFLFLCFCVLRDFDSCVTCHYPQAFVPYIAVAAHIARNGKKPERKEGKAFAVLPTPVITNGVPCHLEGRWGTFDVVSNTVPSTRSPTPSYHAPLEASLTSWPRPNSRAPLL